MRELRRIGKRIAIGVEGDLWLVLHLMIAGRLHWRPPQAKLAGRKSLAAFDFPTGSLVLTEAGTKHRASLSVVAGEEALHAVDPGGIDVFTSDLDSFRDALTAENRTLKRALTDPRILSGIGNAYSDEILHAAQLSPVTLTHKLQPEEWQRLFTATRDTLRLWIDRLQAEAKADFPEKVTAFRKDMAVHGRYGEPCPRCGEKIQRIRYADNETNYCARCQTGGRFWPIAVCPGYCGRTGRGPSRRWRRLSGARGERVGRTLLSDAFDLAVDLRLSRLLLTLQPQVPKIKSKIKGVGQGCPTHTHATH